MGNNIALASSGLKEISGVGGPIEDPIVRENNRVFHDVEVTVPQVEYKSKFNFLPFAYTFMQKSFTLPAEVIHSLFDTIRVTQSRRFYHKKLRRVPEIWECQIDDVVCTFEAEAQFKRDRLVEQDIIKLLSKRLRACEGLAQSNQAVHCKEVAELLQKTENAWQIKYGDIGFYIDARRTLNKQKNRFIEDRYLARKAGTKIDENDS